MACAEGSARRAVRAGATVTGAVRVVVDDNEKRHFTKADMERQLRLAEVNHCLSFEQVSDELIEDYNISDGIFDTVAEYRYTVPSFTSIGRLYQGLVLSTMKNDDAAQAILDAFSSFISDKISDFKTDLYYQNPDYLEWSYREGKWLD